MRLEDSFAPDPELYGISTFGESLDTKANDIRWDQSSPGHVYGYFTHGAHSYRVILDFGSYNDEVIQGASIVNIEFQIETEGQWTIDQTPTTNSSMKTLSIVGNALAMKIGQLLDEYHIDAIWFGATPRTGDKRETLKRSSIYNKMLARLLKYNPTNVFRFDTPTGLLTVVLTADLPQDKKQTIIDYLNHISNVKSV